MRYDNENQLEDAIYYTKGNENFDRGLGCYMHDHVLRQQDIGVYGVADLIGINIYEKDKDGQRDLDIMIYELKLDEINIETVCQVARYKHGISRFITKNIHKFKPFYWDIKTVLVGRTICPSDDFRYLCSATETGIYTYDLSHEGLSFKSQATNYFDKMPWALDPYRDLAKLDLESFYRQTYREAAEYRANRRYNKRVASTGKDEIDILFEKREMGVFDNSDIDISDSHLPF